MIVETLSEKRVKMAACGEDHIGCLVGHGWVPDEEVKACMACKKSFTAIRRRVRIIIIISLHYALPVMIILDTISLHFILFFYPSIIVVSVVVYFVVAVQLNGIHCLIKDTLILSESVISATCLYHHLLTLNEPSPVHTPYVCVSLSVSVSISKCHCTILSLSLYVHVHACTFTCGVYSSLFSVCVCVRVHGVCPLFACIIICKLNNV